MNLITREQAQLRPPRYSLQRELSAKSTLHWNGPTITLGGQVIWDHLKCAGIVRGIQNFHMDEPSRHWSDIAYNFLVCPHGYVFEGRGLNIVNGANGTTVGNHSSHAICVLAGEDNPFPEAEKRAFRECVKYIADNTNAPDDAIGHRDHKQTDCPGDERYVWVHQGMPVVEKPHEKEDFMGAVGVTNDGQVVSYVVKKSTGEIWQTIWNGREWQNTTVPNGNSPAKAPNGLSGVIKDNRVDLFAIGEDFKQYHGYRVNVTDPKSLWKWESLVGDFS